MAKVTVVIPAYNAMKYLPETIDNLLQQTLEDFEAIVVNDGSSDETEEWVSQITDPRIKLVSQENQGLSGARNTGIAHASCEYIAFLDADDLWEPTKLEKQVKCLDENPEVGLVYTWVALMDESSQPTGRTFKSDAEGYVWKQLIESNIVGCGSVAMVRRQCFEQCGVFDRNLRSFVEDWDMWLRLAPHYPFKVVKEPLVYYRQVSNSASRNWEAMEQSFRLVIEKAFADVSPELQPLKGRSYGCANMCLAWKPLQSVSKDYNKAKAFRQQAVQQDPRLRFTKEYLRLSLAIALMQWFGSEGYSKFLSFVYTVRGRQLTLKR